MSILSRNLDLRNPADQKELLEKLAAAGLPLEAAALEHALRSLSDDWLQLAGGDICSLRRSEKGSEGIGLREWVSAVQALYGFRNHRNIEKVVTQLCIQSHENLDALLVLKIAQRYHLRGFEVTFEPYDEATTDLLVVRDPYRLYIEAKRENWLEHVRQKRIQEISTALVTEVTEGLAAFSAARHLRIEIKLSKLFSDAHFGKVVDELKAKAVVGTVGSEEQLESVRGSSMILMRADDEFYYKKGIFTGLTRVTTKPAPLFAPQSSPIRCVFDLLPNLKALGARIRMAAEQLKRDLERDEAAYGFLALGTLLGTKEVVDAIQKRFWPRLPARCWGVTLMATNSCVIPHSELSPEHIDIMSYAALDPEPFTAMPPLE